MDKLKTYKQFFNHWQTANDKAIIDELEELCQKNNWHYIRADENTIELLSEQSKM